jgi:hypothetical protein
MRVVRPNLFFYLVKYSPNQKLLQEKYMGGLVNEIHSQVCPVGVAQMMVFSVFTTCSIMALL